MKRHILGYVQELQPSLHDYFSDLIIKSFKMKIVSINNTSLLVLSYYTAKFAFHCIFLFMNLLLAEAIRRES